MNISSVQQSEIVPDWKGNKDRNEAGPSNRSMVALRFWVKFKKIWETSKLENSKRQSNMIK